MGENIQREKIRTVLRLLRERLESTAKLEREVPSLQESKEDLEWMLESEDQSPAVTNDHPSERVMSNLVHLEGYLEEFRIPPPDPKGPFVIAASSTTSSSDYMIHVKYIRVLLPDDPEVTGWSEEVSESYDKLRQSQDRSDKVQARLSQLDTRLSELHQRAKEASLSVSAEIASPIEAAELLRELLVTFKGYLINRCKSGKGTSYSRIADNLAIAAAATRSAITEQQDTYDSLHHELSEIAKARASPHGERLRELLATLEDHILIVTNAIDPDLLGVSFD